MATSVTRLGYFLKVLGNSITKLTQILGIFFCYFKNLSLDT